MYKIGLRDGSPVSAGRMVELKGGEAYTNAFKPGQAVCIIEGVLKYAGVQGSCPDAIVSEVYDDPETLYTDTAICMLLTEDMLLEVPVKGTDAQIEHLEAGIFIGFGDFEVDASGTSEYCQVMDTLGAKTAGDKILVRFIHNNKATT